MNKTKKMVIAVISVILILIIGGYLIIKEPKVIPDNKQELKKEIKKVSGGEENVKEKKDVQLNIEKYVFRTNFYKSKDILVKEKYDVGDTISVNWTAEKELSYYGTELNVCLMGYKNGEEINPVQERGGCLHDYGYTLDTTTIDAGVYKWVIPKNVDRYFEETPEEFVFEITMLDNHIPSGDENDSTGWDGLVSRLKSGKFRINSEL